MSDLHWARPTPDGAWVTVHTFEPGAVIVQRWDPDAPAYGHVELRWRRRDIWTLRARSIIRRLWKKARP